MSEIEKRSKGQLIVPIDLDLNILLEDSEFIFSADERMQLLRFIIMFDVHSLNIKKLSENFKYRVVQFKMIWILLLKNLISMVYR